MAPRKQPQSPNQQQAQPKPPQASLLDRVVITHVCSLLERCGYAEDAERLRQGDAELLEAARDAGYRLWRSKGAAGSGAATERVILTPKGWGAGRR